MSPQVKVPSRSEYLFLAKVAEEAERYEDLVTRMKGLTYTYGALTVEERNLLSVAYKNVTNNLRSSWRIADSLEKMEASRATPRQVMLIRRQREKIEGELADACQDAIKLLDERLLKTAKQGEEMVYYHKMKGDYYRYMAEFASKQDQKHYSDLSLNGYKFAYKHALAHLDPMHPTRLGLALNFAVYYHDVLKSPERACHLGKHALDEAVLCMDESSAGQDTRDALMILQLLRDDLVVWSAEIKKEGPIDH